MPNAACVCVCVCVCACVCVCVCVCCVVCGVFCVLCCVVWCGVVCVLCVLCCVVLCCVVCACVRACNIAIITKQFNYVNFKVFWVMTVIIVVWLVQTFQRKSYLCHQGYTCTRLLSVMSFPPKPCQFFFFLSLNCLNNNEK
jgi:hypothetical protein